MIPEDQEILSAELVYSDAEVLAEFQERCEEAAETRSNSPRDLQQAAKAVVRVLSSRGAWLEFFI
jgi:hypothetical protein